VMWYKCAIATEADSGVIAGTKFFSRGTER